MSSNRDIVIFAFVGLLMAASSISLANTFGNSTDVIDTAPNEPPYPTSPAQDSQSQPLPPAGSGVSSKMKHPGAAKGLIKIQADGSYLYKTELQKSDRSWHFRMGVIEAPTIVAADGTTFKDMYKETEVFTLMLEYEQHPWVGKAGKLGWVLGLGFYTAQGNGRFLATRQEAEERYRFFAFPLHAGLIYKLETADRQWMVPYTVGGLSYFGLLELRDDNKDISPSGSPAAFGGGGILFNISALDREMAFNLQSEYGISNLWLGVDYRYIQSFSEDVDVSGNLITGSISTDF